MKTELSLYLFLKLMICGSVLNIIILEFVKSHEHKIRKSEKITKTNGTFFTIISMMNIVLFEIIKNDLDILMIFPPYFLLVFIFGYIRKRVSMRKALLDSAIANLLLFAVIQIEKGFYKGNIGEVDLLMYYSIVFMMIWKTGSGLKSIKLKMLTLKEWIITVASVIISTCIIVVSISVMKNYDDTHINVYMQIIILLIISIDVILLYLIFQVNEKCSNEKELMQLQQESEFQQQYMDNVRQMDEHIRKIRHDMKNQLNVVAALIEEEQYEKAKDYITSYSGQVVSKERYINTDNEIINAVINSKVLFCKDNGIQIYTTVQKNIGKIEDRDMCSLLGNILDNAIEAECRLNEADRHIELQITMENTAISIIVKNRIYESVLELNNDMKTTKGDSKNHGLGTKIIAKIVKKYDGYLDYFEEDDFFCCEIKL